MGTCATGAAQLQPEARWEARLLTDHLQDHEANVASMIIRVTVQQACPTCTALDWHQPCSLTDDGRLKYEHQQAGDKELTEDKLRECLLGCGQLA